MKERRTFQRVIVLVVDSFGIGRAADAHEYGDKGADTYGISYSIFPIIRKRCILTACAASDWTC